MRTRSPKSSSGRTHATCTAGFLAWALAASGSLAAEPPATPGVIDLAGSWRVGVEAGDAGDRRWGEAALPATWDQLQLTGHDGQVLFRRAVSLPAAWQEELAPGGLAVLVDAARYGAYDLFAGGTRIGGADPGLPAPAIRVFEVPEELVDAGAPPGGAGRHTLNLELRYHRVGWASDIDRRAGPVGGRLLLGDLEALRSIAELDRQSSRRGALHSVLISVLLAAVGLYHLQLFSRRRDRLEYLWFGAVAISCAAVVFAVRLSYSLTDSFAVGRRLNYLTVHLTIALLIQLLWPYLHRPIGRLLRGYQCSHLVIAAVVTFLPIEWVVRSNTLRWTWILPFLIGLASLLASRSLAGDPEARTIGLGGLAMVGAGVVEVFYQVLGRGTSYPLPAWAFAVFALAMAVSLSNRYSRLHLELDHLRHQLEERVEDATAELSNANRRLQAENAERQLAEESMRMLERAVEQSVDGIVVADLAGSTEFLNEAWAQMHGYEVPEVLGYDLNLFHTREQMQGTVYPLLKQVRDQGSFDGEVGHRRRDGSSFPTWMTANLLHDPDGEAEGIVAIARDITERRRGEEEQQQLEARFQHAAKLESLGDLAAGIAHDYNNLLTGMMVHADLAGQEVVEDSPVHDKIRRIERAAERSADLSDQLLAFAGEDEPELEAARLNDLLRDMEPLLRERVPEQHVLQFQLKRALPPVDVDPGQLRRVVLRLVANAVEAVGEEKGVITVRTSKVRADRDYFDGARPSEDLEAGKYVFFEVSDSGVGIDDETRERMFDPFFTTKPVGRGLGLATSLGIVGAHGGGIKVYSQPGRGTTFEVLFPASTRREVAARPRAALEWQPSGKVLVVDDEELVLEVSREILASRGFTVLTAAGGAQAIETYGRHRGEIVAVVLDMTMPEIDGEEVFWRVREIDPDAQVIMMSGYSKKKVPPRILEEGLGGFLHKPFKPQDLMDKLRELLEPQA